MTTSSSPPNFSMVRAEVPWTQADGKPTTYFFRLIENLFKVAGSGSTSNISLAGLINEAFSQSTRNGPDYDRAIADLTMLLATLPNESGRIATLERRIADLEQLLLESQRRVDTNPMLAQLDNVTAFALGTH